MMGSAKISRLLVLALAPLLLRAQSDQPVTFQSKVTLVPVPVVVRDRNSHAVGDLTRDNFQVFDNGKLQSITRFSLEKSGIATGGAPTPAAPAGVARASNPTTPLQIPDHFVAYVFDDLHFKIGDLMQAKIAALKHFEGLETGSTRAAVFATSGINPVDFTADRDKLKAALNRLMPHAKTSSPQIDCPYLTYYAADLIANHDDSQATGAAVSEAMRCPVPPPSRQVAMTLVRSSAFQVAATGETDTRITLSVLRSVVKRIAALPGQRTLVLISPGFLFPSHEQEISQLIDLAVRMNVVINSIDGRGLYVDARYDASRPSSNGALADYERTEASEAGETLGLLADGTGGTAFANSNDLLEGFRRAGAQPEFTYVLGFSPTNLKTDGKFHSIKVKLKDTRGLTVQARRGYFAPKHAVDPADQIKQDVDDALFSRQELSDFPLAIKSQASKEAGGLDVVTVLVHVGLKGFHFAKADGLNNGKLTLVTALFDQNGNYVKGVEATADLHYKDEILEARINSGATVKTSVDGVKPGTYLIRLVARDGEGQMMAATNGSVAVP